MDDQLIFSYVYFGNIQFINMARNKNVSFWMENWENVIFSNFSEILLLMFPFVDFNQ